MADISIFAKRGFLGNHYPKIVSGSTILRLSGETRGAQVAEHIGAKLNPKSGYENDLCIFVKGYKMNEAKPGDYVDFSDQKVSELAPFLKNHPEVNVIAHSEYAYEYLKNEIPNKVICIPQQHINWENDDRKKNGTLIGGYIGRPSPVSLEIQDEIRNTLQEIGVGFIVSFEWTTRQDAIDFYKSIDLLILGGFGRIRSDLWQITPNKMINAASFGIPSIAFMRVGYKEWEGNYTQFESMDDLQGEVEKFKDEDYYTECSGRINERAKEYHIDLIGQKYKGLCLN